MTGTCTFCYWYLYILLVGQRRWRVRLLQGTTVEVSTETHDQDRDTLNRIGVSVLRDGFGKNIQSEIWEQYLTNIASYHVTHEGASAGRAVLELDEWLNTDNPWFPATPYPGAEVQ